MKDVKFYIYKKVTTTTRRLAGQRSVKNVALSQPTSRKRREAVKTTLQPMPIYVKNWKYTSKIGLKEKGGSEDDILPNANIRQELKIYKQNRFKREGRQWRRHCTQYQYRSRTENTSSWGLKVFFSCYKNCNLFITFCNYCNISRNEVVIPRRLKFQFKHTESAKSCTAIKIAPIFSILKTAIYGTR